MALNKVKLYLVIDPEVDKGQLWKT